MKEERSDYYFVTLICQTWKAVHIDDSYFTSNCSALIILREKKESWAEWIVSLRGAVNLSYGGFVVGSGCVHE